MTSITWVGASRGGIVHPFWTGLLLGSLLFVPGALGFFFESTSFASGTGLVCIMALALAAGQQIPFNSRDAQNVLIATIMVSVVLAAHLLIAYVVNSDPMFDIGRAFLSLLLFGLVLLSVPVVCEAFMISGNSMPVIIRGLCVLFVVIAILSLLKIQPEVPNLGEKPTFPYTEPSFLGFSIPAVLIFAMARSSLIVRVMLITVFLALGYALSNFTVIAACGLAAVVTLPMSWLAAGFLAFVLGKTALDLSYYTDRLNFDWSNSTNLSSLVYVQGWQMLQEALHKTYWWGLGFQQLGIGYTNVPASVRINALLGHDANLQDGGFILSKIGGELGALGLVLIAAYLYVVGRSALRLRTASRKRLAISDGELFARSCVIGYLIELVVRGTNYFTGTFVLLLAGLLYLYKARDAKVIPAEPCQ